MRIVTKFPHAVCEIENLWVPLGNGARLAARVWLPEDADSNPVPVILEYIPYRKRDFTTARDEPMHRYFAGHGYAAVRLDMRGSGDSDGLMFDEYLQQEQDDAVEAIAWLAAQPWCSGTVGMMGNSWGGFNALQVAARRPPALKAIITSCSTDDRYADDMHYMGGCLLNDNMDWGTTFFAILPRPPDPAIVGAGWRERWLERLQNAVQPMEDWLAHQRRDAFWKHGSVCEDYGRIECAVLAVGGWLDGYSNAIPRLLSHLRCPRQGLIGPWAHMYPHLAVPGPGTGFLQEAVGWWDHWLKGRDTGLMSGPMLRAYMGEAVPAQPYYETCPGRWVAEDRWPSPRIAADVWHLGDGRLSRDRPAPASLAFRSPETTGLAGGEWCPYGTGGKGPEFPADQRADDGKSLTFDSAPLAERLEILGAPVATLALRSDRPVATIVARLCDVAPDGASTRVSYGVLNLTHRDGHEFPTPLEPGRTYVVRVQMNDCAYAFRPGHRLRLALSTNYWPMVIPAPAAATLTVDTAESLLTLPQRPAGTAGRETATLGEPESAQPHGRIVLEAGRWENRVERDLKTGRVTVFATRQDGLVRLESNGLEIGGGIEERMSIRDGDPLSAETEMSRRILIGRGDWRTRIDARATLTVTKTEFRLVSELRAFESDSEIFSRTWDKRLKRDLV